MIPPSPFPPHSFYGLLDLHPDTLKQLSTAVKPSLRVTYSD